MQRRSTLSLSPPRTGDILAVRAKGYRVLGDGLAFIFMFALPQLAQPTNRPDEALWLVNDSRSAPVTYLPTHSTLS